MSNATKSQEDWNSHLAECMPAVMASSNTLQILVGTNSAIPFDRPMPFPCTRTNETKDGARKQNISYLKKMRRAGGIWQVDRGENRPSECHTISSINDAGAGIRKHNPNCSASRHMTYAVTSQYKDIGQRIPKLRLGGDNVDVSSRRTELRKVASFNAASLIDCSMYNFQGRRDQAIDPSTSGLHAPILGPPLDFSSNTPSWNVLTEDNQTSLVSFPWIIPGLALTMLLWQEHLFSLPLKIDRWQPTNQVPVRNINFVKTRPNSSEILLYISDEMSSSFQMSINFARIPRDYERVSRNEGTFSEGRFTESWVFVLMIDLASVKGSRNSMIAPTDVVKTKETIWNMVAFPTGAISKNFERRTADGHVITRYELCSSGRWPLVDAQNTNLPIWLPWVDAAAIGAGAIEFET